MKIAIISDIHGNLSALQAGLAEIDQADVDHIINRGESNSRWRKVHPRSWSLGRAVIT